MSDMTDGEDGGQSVTVSLPAALIRLFPGAEDEVRMEASAISDVISELDRRWPGMQDRLCDTRPAIRRHLNIFVDGRRARLDTVLKPGTRVIILTAMSGG